MSDSSTERNPIEVIAEEFLERRRRGERPSVEEYAALHPGMAEEIRAVLPAFVLVGDLGAELEMHEDPSRRRSLPPPPQFGDYRVIREIGRGGMGVVYEALQVSLGRQVALKVLPASVASDRKALERFRREARAAARLHHTNIVPVFDVGREGDIAYYAMQYIRGQGLDQVILELANSPGPGRNPPDRLPGEGARPTAEVGGGTMASPPDATSSRAGQLGPVTRTLMADGLDPGAKPSLDEVASSGPLAADLPGPATAAQASPSSQAVLPGGSAISSSAVGRTAYFRSVAWIGHQAAQGLAYAHARGVVHRDIKPSNLLLDTSGVVWIADFGLAKAEEDGLTATGDIVGTIRYMAPERFRGEGDGRADVYSLGVTLYELLTLRQAYPSADRLEVIQRIKSEAPTRPRAVDSRIPRDLETILLKAIDKEPARRYASAEAMAEDLGRFLAGETILARRASTADRLAHWARRHPGIAALGAALATVLVAATIASLVAASRFRDQAGRQAIIAGERESARAMAEAVNGRLETLLVDMHAARGQAAAERDDPATAMLWYARASELAARTPDRAAVNRILARAWEQRAAMPVLAFEHPRGEVVRVAFQPHGGHMMTLTDDRRVHFWRLDDGSELPAIRDQLLVTAAAWSPDGERVALGLAGGGIEIYRLAGSELIFGAPFPGSVDALAFSRDGKKLAGGGREARVFDAESGGEIGPPLTHPDFVISVEFSPDGGRLLTGCLDGRARVFDVAPSGYRPRFVTAQANLGNGGSPELRHEVPPRFSASGDAILAATAWSEASWYDVASGRVTGKVALDLFSPRSPAVSPDGRWGAVCGYYGTHIFPAGADAAGTPRLLPHANETSACQFSPDSTLLASSSWDRTVRVWTVHDGKPACAPIPHEQIVQGAEFSPDGQHLATSQYGGLVRAWRLPAANREFPGPWTPLGRATLRGSRDGTRAIAASFGNYHAPHVPTSIIPRVFDVGSGQALGDGFGPTEGVQDAALDSRGTHAVAISYGEAGSALHSWEVATGRRGFDPRPIPGIARSVDIRADDALVATVGRQGEVRVFDARDGREVAGAALSPPSSPGSGAHTKARFVGIGTLVVFHDGRIFVLDDRTCRQRIPPIAVRPEDATSCVIAISPGGRHAAIGSTSRNDSRFRVHDLATGGVASPVLPHRDVPYAAVFTADGRRLLTGGRDGQLLCWDWAAGKQVGTACKADDEILEVALMPGDRFAITGVRSSGSGVGGQVEVWDIASGKRVAPSRRLGGGCIGLAVAPEGRRGLARLDSGWVAPLDLSDLVAPDPRPIGELIRIGELASGQRLIGGDLTGLTADEWIGRWRGSTARPPGMPSPAASASPAGSGCLGVTSRANPVPVAAPGRVLPASGVR